MNFEMKHRLAVITIACAGIMSSPAMAQSKTSGPYAVARAGVQLDADLHLPKTPASARLGPGQTPVASVLPRDIDAKPGFTGEMGLGYNFGGFRLEGTVGYDTAAINGGRLGKAGYTGHGRLKSLDLGIAGYVDLNRDGRVKPFIGGGVGASRTDANLSRLTVPSGPVTSGSAAIPASRRAGTRINDRDWGFRWHLDAGVGYAITPKTTLELAGRYTRTTALDFSGSSSRTATPNLAAAVTPQTFKTRASSTSLMLGIRQAF